MSIFDDYGDIARRQKLIGTRQYDGVPKPAPEPEDVQPPDCGLCWDHGYTWNTTEDEWRECRRCQNRSGATPPDDPPHSDR